MLDLWVVADTIPRQKFLCEDLDAFRCPGRFVDVKPIHRKIKHMRAVNIAGMCIIADHPGSFWERPQAHRSLNIDLERLLYMLAQVFLGCPCQPSTSVVVVNSPPDG